VESKLAPRDDDKVLQTIGFRSIEFAVPTSRFDMQHSKNGLSASLRVAKSRMY